MTDLTDRIIDSLAAQHAVLTDLIGALDDEGLTAPSGASEWTVAQVLSHLGSGAEISQRTLDTAIAGTPAQAPDNQAVWARWDGATPQEQASWFVQHDSHLVETLQGLTSEQRGTLRIDMGFLPQPVTLEVATGMRLNEVTQHCWDALAGIEPDTTLDETGAELLVDLYADSLGFMLGFLGKADQVEEPVVLSAFGHGLVVEDAVSLVAEPPVAPTAHFAGEKEAFVRLVGGRLTPDHTPDDVAVSGNVTLEDLRRVFPGF